MAQAKISPFDFVNSITFDKRDILTEATDNQYVPFLINRGLSYFADCVLYANDMNINNELPKRAQYLYLLNTIPKRKRFSKWAKKLENEDIELVSRLYNCNDRRASEILSILTPDQLESLQQLETGNSNGRARN